MEKIIHYCWFGDKPLSKLAKKCIKSWKKFLPDYKIIKWTEENVNLNECIFIKEAYANKKWAFVADYVRTKALNEYGGIYFDTDMEVTKDISDLLESNKTFLGVEDTGYVAVGVWYEREKKSFLSSELLKRYRSIKKFDINKMADMSIPKIVSEILEPYGLKKGGTKIQLLENDIKIYPRDYFYPYSFHRDNNVFSENTCMIHYYDASWLPKRDKREMMLVRRFGRDKTNKILNTYRRLKQLIIKCLKIPLFPIVLYRHHKAKMIVITDSYLNRLNETINCIEKNKDKEYITIYNKLWLGVTSATNELFENLVDCNEIYRKKDVKAIGNAILNANIKQVVFSSFALGWEELVKYLRTKNKNIKIKVFWHGSHSQILDPYGWKRNLEFIHLHQSGYVDAIGTCKESLMNFYKKQGYNAYFITNKVSEIKITKEESKIKTDKDKKVIGIYAAKCDDWRKNMYSQMAAVKLIENAVIDMVPLNEQAKTFAEQYGIEITGVEKPISREKMMQRMAKNDINLYVTFSECAPMLPLESMELGVPCITGNNHHYFKNNKLEKYIVINNETDIEEIKRKILECIENKAKIMQYYKQFSKKNIEESKEEVKQFLNA